MEQRFVRTLYRFSDQLRFPQSFLHTRSASKKSVCARRASILLRASLVQLIEINRVFKGVSISFGGNHRSDQVRDVQLTHDVRIGRTGFRYDGGDLGGMRKVV